MPKNIKSFLSREENKRSSMVLYQLFKEKEKTALNPVEQVFISGGNGKQKTVFFEYRNVIPKSIRMFFQHMHTQNYNH